MNFSELAIFLEKLDATSSRLEITRILSDLFTKAEEDEIDKITYLVLGSLAPNYKGIVFNVAEKLMINVLAMAYSAKPSDVLEIYKKEGDLGNAAYILSQNSERKKTDTQSVIEIYNRLYDIAADSGEKSVERKVEKTAEILSGVDPLSARYLARIPVGKLRLGFSDKTIIDALSWMETGNKSKSKVISEAYNILPDVGLLAKSIKKDGIDKAVAKAKPIVGVPVLPMLAQRIKSPTEMIEKMGDVYVEPKFDGLRILIHFSRNKSSGKLFAKAFTRNSNDVTEMFPEIVKLGEYLKCDEVILDSEAVGMDPEMKRLADFQTTMQRRRIHKVEETAKNIPLRFQVFDILFCDGENLMNLPYEKRREYLERCLTENKLFVVDEKIKTKDPEVINEEYRKKIREGLEGIIVKKVDAAYVSGRTGWRWVKMKQEEESEGKLSDTVDAVVMGYTVGRGKRAGFGVGQFLVGVVDPSSGNIQTLTKIGTGLTDEQFRELKSRLSALEVKEKPKEYELHKNYTPDYWVVPKLVVELAGDDLTKSPTHTSGYALRFPRLVNFRDDKGVNEATTVEEIKRLYQLQYK